MRAPFERLQCKKPSQECVPFGGKVLAGQTSTEPVGRKNPRYKFGIWLGTRNNSAECFMATAEKCVQSSWNQKGGTGRNTWDKETIKRQTAVGAVYRPGVRVDPISIPPLFVGGNDAEGTISQSKTPMISEPLWGAPFATRPWTGNAHKPTLIVSVSLRKVQKAWIEEVS